MKRKFVFSIDEHYHLYSRGVDKRRIFLDDEDWKRFVRLLYVCNGTKPIIYRDVAKKQLGEIDIGDKIVAIGAYCLMPNHFHILVKEITEGGISKFMKKLLTAYSSYFNIKNERTGSLFESAFKAEHVFSDEYLKYLYSYIHLNPVKLIQSDWKESGIKDIKRAKEHVKDYAYSSYPDYCEVGRNESIILIPDVFPQYFGTVEEMQTEVADWLNFQDPNGSSAS